MKTRYKSDKDNLYQIIPIALLIFLIPMIVYLKIIPLKGVEFDYWNGQNQNYDFFSYYKMFWFILFTVFAVVTFFIKLYQDNNIKSIKKTKLYIPMAVYVFFVIISSITSNYKSVALNGFVDRYEGMYVLIGYMIILFITINLTDTKLQIKTLIGALMFSALIIGIIGAFQYVGKDLFQSDFGKKMMLPSSFEKNADKLNFTLGKNGVYSTLYHYNYVGSYTAMLFPFSLALFAVAKNKVLKILMGIFSLLMFVFLIICRSRAGLVGTAISVVILLVMLRKEIVKQWKLVIAILLSFIVLFVGANAATKGSIGARVKTLFMDAEALKSKNEAKSFKSPINNIEINGNKIKITEDSKVLNIEKQPKTVVFKDAEEKILEVKFDNKTGNISFRDEKYKDYNFILGNLNNQSVLILNKPNFKVSFGITNEGFKYAYSSGKVVEPKPIQTFGFEGKETLGSARGYIWSRSIPLLKNTIFKGYGPDTFAIVFPQYDYVGKYKAYGTSDMLVDKAHNLYLQTALSTGVISLIALIALFLMYIVWSIKLYIKGQFDDFYKAIGIASLASVIGYLGAGFFNDSVISVAPVFWILLGIGISVNYKIQQESKSA